jgi:hypothetical protein
MTKMLELCDETRRRVQARYLVAGAFAAAAAAFAAFTALGSSPASAAQAQYAPNNTAPPTITGTPAVGQTLTASSGTWAGDQPIVFTYQWQRCNSAGANCVAIPNETGSTYTVVAADVGNTLRVAVTGTNASGSGTAISQPTAVVTATAPGTDPPGARRLADGTVSIPVTSVSLPHRLVVDRVEYNPNPVRTYTKFLGRFRVRDTRGYVVRDALVYALGVPYNRILNAAEVRSGEDGFAVIEFTPTRNLPLRNGNSMVIFIRARKPGENVLTGVSTRRLTQLRLANRPANTR